MTKSAQPGKLSVRLGQVLEQRLADSGNVLVEQLHRLHPDLPIVVMTAWASVEVAVRAMRQGANDFLEKPWNNQRLLSLLGNQVKLAEARQRGRRLADENAIRMFWLLCWSTQRL